jgi:hypothetical protein
MKYHFAVVAVSEAVALDAEAKCWHCGGNGVMWWTLEEVFVGLQVCRFVGGMGKGERVAADVEYQDGIGA